MRTLGPDDFYPGLLVTISAGPYHTLILPGTGEQKTVECTRDHGRVFRILAFDPPFVLLELFQDQDTVEYELGSPVPVPIKTVRAYRVSDITLMAVSEEWFFANRFKRLPTDYDITVPGAGAAGRQLPSQPGQGAYAALLAVLKSE